MYKSNALLSIHNCPGNLPEATLFHLTQEHHWRSVFFWHVLLKARDEAQNQLPGGCWLHCVAWSSWTFPKHKASAKLNIYEDSTATDKIQNVATLTCQLGERSVGRMWWWITSAAVSRLTPMRSNRREICGIETVSPSNCGWTVSMSCSNANKLSAQAVVSKMTGWHITAHIAKPTLTYLSMNW